MITTQGLAALSTTSTAATASSEEGRPAEKATTSLSEDESFSSTTVYLRRKNDVRRLKNEKLAAYRQSLSNSTAYAGHLSSLVFGKIKSLWSAQASTFNLGLNQFAGRTFYFSLAPVCVFLCVDFDRCVAGMSLGITLAKLMVISLPSLCFVAQDIV